MDREVGRCYPRAGGQYMKAKKPRDLKVARHKRKMAGLRTKVRKDVPWYASAVAQIGISARAARSDKPTS